MALKVGDKAPEFKLKDSFEKEVSLSAVIKSSFNPVKDILITCGGDSKFVTKSLETNQKKIINAPNLVMEGMIIHHLSLKQLI